jgi:signal peptidase I
MAVGPARVGRRSLGGELSEYAEAVLAAILFALFFKTFVFEAFRIPSASMEDNLLVGDHILVNKFVYGPHRGPWARLLPHRDVRRGDVVVFRDPVDLSRDLVKRAVALGGSTVHVVGKKLLVNGVEAVEPWAVHRDPDIAPEGPGVPLSVSLRDHFGPSAVPPETFFAMGDNRDDSQDSRFWGPVPGGLVKGRAVLVYWSYDALPAGAFSGQGAALRRLIHTGLHFFSRTRWNRTFRSVK